ncbi:hypothetical protein BDU57DRAFT_594837 [Ampelomyces quisqualis]|uniref:Uncharacterized protein n=1 Tax=Ampelomyces quisqualis TaxID=50730 RepID=A0A6A5QKD5_AMPQU|nr:hypothetical protein BDU57DRAFT_594837 [Ampelomyces quisqualis]
MYASMTADSYVWAGDEGREDMEVLDQLVDNEDMTPDQAVEKTIQLAQKPQPYPTPLVLHCEATARGVIVAAARTSPERHSKLVAYVHKLRRKIVVDPITGRAYEHDGEVLWKDLPTFGYTIADELHSIPDPKPTPEKVAKWQNTIAFFAQLDASTDDPKLDFTHTWALKYISLALISPEARYDHESTLRLACIWFVYDAEKLWQRVPEDDGFSLTEWQRWKSALEEKGSQVKDENTMDLIDAALAEMKRVENQ